ncbi:MAG: alpha-ribazole phosphatase [Bernardetiaceae bacterium]|nr:alpha-ribazole phosphatase [Bernardetiaceae bacterium]
MYIYLVRHTAIQNPQQLCYGHADMPLAESFEQEAKHILSLLPKQFDRLYASPSARCLALAKRIKSIKALQTDERLKEMHFGDWELKPWAAIPKQNLQPWMDNYVEVRTPKGENLKDLYTRVASFFDELIEEKIDNNEQKIAVIAHGGVLRCVWAYLLDIPLHTIFRLNIEYGEAFLFEHNQDPNRRRILKKKL